MTCWLPDITDYGESSRISTTCWTHEMRCYSRHRPPRFKDISETSGTFQGCAGGNWNCYSAMWRILKFKCLYSETLWSLYSCRSLLSNLSSPEKEACINSTCILYATHQPVSQLLPFVITETILSDTSLDNASPRRERHHYPSPRTKQPAYHGSREMQMRRGRSTISKRLWSSWGQLWEFLWFFWMLCERSTTGEFRRHLQVTWIWV